MSYITIFGLTVAALSTISFFPQLLKTCKTKSAKDISLGMFSIFCAGVLLWLVYGILIDDLPVIVANIHFRSSIHHPDAQVQVQMKQHTQII
jgi:MtN3 and saliva related transmembrane protein